MEGAADLVRLDLAAVLALYRQPRQRILRWLFFIKGVTRIDAMGAVPQAPPPSTGEFVISLVRDRDGIWDPTFHNLNDQFTSAHLAPLLLKSKDSPLVVTDTVVRGQGPDCSTIDIISAAEAVGRDN